MQTVDVNETLLEEMLEENCSKMVLLIFWVGQCLFIRGRQVNCRTFSNIPDLYPRDASNTPSCDSKNVSSYCQMSLGAKSPPVETTRLE